MQLLRIDSSARGQSVTRQLTLAFRNSWAKRHPDGRVIERDLSRTPLPPITDDWSATFAPPDQLTAAQQGYLALSDSLIAELLSSDTVVIGAPMYNFTISWELKAWIDQIVRMGKTIGRSPDGLRGLAGGRRLVVVTARGGDYSSKAPGSHRDHQEPYLRDVFSFIGIDEVQFIHADRQLSAAAAQSRSDALFTVQQLA